MFLLMNGVPWLKKKGIHLPVLLDKLIFQKDLGWTPLNSAFELLLANNASKRDSSFPSLKMDSSETQEFGKEA